MGSESSNFALLFEFENSRLANLDFFLFFTCGMITACTAQLVPSWPQSVPFSLLRGHVGRYIRFAFLNWNAKVCIHRSQLLVGQRCRLCMSHYLSAASLCAFPSFFSFELFLLDSLLSSFFVLHFHFLLVLT